MYCGYPDGKWYDIEGMKYGRHNHVQCHMSADLFYSEEDFAPMKDTIQKQVYAAMNYKGDNAFWEELEQFLF